MFREADVKRLSSCNYQIVIVADEFTATVDLEDERSRNLVVLITMAIQIAFAEAKIDCLSSIKEYFMFVANEPGVAAARGPNGECTNYNLDRIIRCNKEQNPMYFMIADTIDKHLNITYEYIAAREYAIERSIYGSSKKD